MSIIPPAEYLARVDSLIGWEFQHGCYALQGNKLYFDPRRYTLDALRTWATLLSDLVMLAVPEGVKWENISEVVEQMPTLRHLHVDSFNKFEGHVGRDEITMLVLSTVEFGGFLSATHVAPRTTDRSNVVENSTVEDQKWKRKRREGRNVPDSKKKERQAGPKIKHEILRARYLKHISVFERLRHWEASLGESAGASVRIMQMVPKSKAQPSPTCADRQGGSGQGKQNAERMRRKARRWSGFGIGIEIGFHSDGGEWMTIDHWSIRGVASNPDLLLMLLLTALPTDVLSHSVVAAALASGAAGVGAGDVVSRGGGRLRMWWAGDEGATEREGCIGALTLTIFLLGCAVRHSVGVKWKEGPLVVHSESCRRERNTSSPRDIFTARERGPLAAAGQRSAVAGMRYEHSSMVSLSLRKFEDKAIHKIRGALLLLVEAAREELNTDAILWKLESGPRTKLSHSQGGQFTKSTFRGKHSKQLAFPPRLEISHDGSRIEVALLKAIQKPAPRLRKFHAQFKNTPQTSHVGALFANQAPVLESIEIPFKFQLPAPWLSNIRTILIGGYYFYLSEIFDILKTTPLVETFSVSIRQSQNTARNAVNTHPLTLPYLTAVNIAGNFTSGIGMLGFVVDIHRATSLEVNLVDPTRTTDEDWTSLYQTFSRVLQGHFEVHPPTRTSLILNPRYFSLKAHGNAGSILQINLQSSLWDERSITSFLASKFQMPIFQTANELDLTFDPDSIKNYNPVFRSFFSSFSNIRVLTLHHERAIRQVHPRIQYMDPSEIPFPALETLKYDWYRGGVFATEPIRQFLVARREAGYPISTLDLTCYSKDIAQALMSMDELEEMKGLKILWCRSGEEELDSLDINQPFSFWVSIHILSMPPTVEIKRVDSFESFIGNKDEKTDLKPEKKTQSLKKIINVAVSVKRHEFCQSNKKPYRQLRLQKSSKRSAKIIRSLTWRSMKVDQSPQLTTNGHVSGSLNEVLHANWGKVENLGFEIGICTIAGAGVQLVPLELELELRCNREENSCDCDGQAKRDPQPLHPPHHSPRPHPGSIFSLPLRSSPPGSRRAPAAAPDSRERTGFENSCTSRRSEVEDGRAVDRRIWIMLVVVVHRRLPADEGGRPRVLRTPTCACTWLRPEHESEPEAEEEYGIPDQEGGENARLREGLWVVEAEAELKEAESQAGVDVDHLPVGVCKKSWGGGLGRMQEEYVPFFWANDPRHHLLQFWWSTTWTKAFGDELQGVQGTPRHPEMHALLETLGLLWRRVSASAVAGMRRERSSVVSCNSIQPSSYNHAGKLA
ncbi:hypothetical protein GALMADRAFT_1362443 [Galerina marginata CBS 339.88]|uniref:Uncharacterized protein n=1 Tax=Galerina marginata (strain CBS 339.88) TaxID=685588 RepID=A0A067S7R7_GALM3|nr:hypothetical protein GALMADRAFT_1362443 [Galerina marginata CBS 339.88]